MQTFTTEDDCPNVGNLAVLLQVLLHKLHLLGMIQMELIAL